VNPKSLIPSQGRGVFRDPHTTHRNLDSGNRWFNRRIIFLDVTVGAIYKVSILAGTFYGRLNNRYIISAINPQSNNANIKEIDNSKTFLNIFFIQSPTPPAHPDLV
jgi:hypothetical protein